MNVFFWLIRFKRTCLISDIVKIINNFRFSLHIPFCLFSIYSGVSRPPLYDLMEKFEIPKER